MGTDRLKISKSLWLVGFVAALVVWAVMSPLRAYADDGKLEQQLNGQQSSQAPASNNGYVYDPDDPYGNGDGNADTPFEILNNRGVRAIDKQVGKDNFVGNLKNALGLTNLAFVLDFVGVVSAIIVIIISIIMLLLVNYPKTVAQTKQTMAHALITVMLIALLPLILDVIYNIILAFMESGQSLSGAVVTPPED